MQSNTAVESAPPPVDAALWDRRLHDIAKHVTWHCFSPHRFPALAGKPRTKPLPKVGLAVTSKAAIIVTRISSSQRANRGLDTGFSETDHAQAWSAPPMRIP